MSESGAALHSPNPTFEVGAAERILSSEWGIEGSVTELVSTQDQNFRVRAADGRQYVLKVSNVAATVEDLEAQDLAMRHIAGRATSFVVPRPIEARDGRRLVEQDGHLLRLVTWVEGTPLADLGYLPPRTLTELGRLAGECCRALADLRDPLLDRELQWDPSRAPALVADLIEEVQDPDDRKLVERATAPLRELDTSSLPRQTVHCDVTDFNVIGRAAADGRVSPVGIVDFGDVCESWRVSEVATAALAAVFREIADPLGAVLSVVRGFVEVIPLGDTEVEAIWPIVLARAGALAISDVHQAKVAEPTPHLARLTEEDWTVLRAVLDVPHPLAIAAIREASGHAPVPAGPAVEEALAAAPRVAPVDLEAGLGSVDLSVGSPGFTAGEWTRREGVQAALGRSRTALGRWGEVRLTASGLPADAAPAALHLGADLFLPVGTEIKAPLAGTVVRVDERSLSLRLDLEIEGIVLIRIAGVAPRLRSGDVLALGAPIGPVCEPCPADVLPSHLHLQICIGGEMPGLVAGSRAAAALAVCPDPSVLVGADAAAPTPQASRVLLERRSRSVPAAAGTYYEEPPEMVRGWRHLLFDSEGRPYVDSVNNVAAVGHSHPAVTAAAVSQLRLLNTNSRFLYSPLEDYVERLLAKCPPELNRVIMVNSGSEAVDLALRLARTHTGREDVIAIDGAYHGWTTATFEMCTYPPDLRDWRQVPPPRIHVARQPDPYRGPSSDAGPYLDSVREACEAAAARGGLAAFVSEPLLGNQGGVETPAGYLAGAYELVRAAGGLCIADEVQVGLGRTGVDFWAFEHDGVVPDIVTIAKGAGNGYPVGAVVCRGEIVDGLGAGSFFSSAGGSPLSCAVAAAVLDTIDAESLQKNAALQGARLRDRLEEMAGRHELIGAVHGRGLFMGVDLVTDRDSKEPASAEAAAICERLRRLGTIVQPTGDRSNVLKIKPPLCIDDAGVDSLVGALDRVLLEGW
jgi:4-aminobutyrate aminotransferase-like enzyme/Ser/Thr protein kinase RdoA (MazF antagonist)